MSPTSVYKYYDEYGRLIYVGITNRGPKRQHEHVKTKDWWQYVRSQEVEHYDTREEALRRESRLIQRYHPPFNTQGNYRPERIRRSYLNYRAAGLDTSRGRFARGRGQRVMVHPSETINGRAEEEARRQRSRMEAAHNDALLEEKRRRIIDERFSGDPMAYRRHLDHEIARRWDRKGQTGPYRLDAGA